eukprot:TRINITY_DN717_c0_g1_i1.p1 TRINITY_DN717_c0_g1~~TRINITY_DN717_c0_g1_i1.p1  ORF type:complete len:164 (-),score=40.24 TRINITY_DN717_c0_g1_i1:112-603(-)
MEQSASPSPQEGFFTETSPRSEDTPEDNALDFISESFMLNRQSLKTSTSNLRVMTHSPSPPIDFDKEFTGPVLGESYCLLPCIPPKNLPPRSRNPIAMNTPFVGASGNLDTQLGLLTMSPVFGKPSPLRRVHSTPYVKRDRFAVFEKTHFSDDEDFGVFSIGN